MHSWRGRRCQEAGGCRHLRDVLETVVIRGEGEALPEGHGGLLGGGVLGCLPPGLARADLAGLGHLAGRPTPALARLPPSSSFSLIKGRRRLLSLSLNLKTFSLSLLLLILIFFFPFFFFSFSLFLTF